MTPDDTAPTAALLGDNKPPSEHPLRERLERTHGELLARKDELLAAASRAPTEIEDDETAGKVTDFIKQLAAATKNANAARVAEKEPYLEGGRQVDGFFKAITDPLEKTKKAIERVLTAYQRKKADEERRRREEEERRAREAAERKRREAEEAAAKLASDEDLDNAISAEEAAKQAAADAAAAQKSADAKAAELSRNRGDYGGVASLRTFWDFRDLDRASLDLEALRNHLPMDGLEKAVRSFIKAGGRELRGVEIFENTTTVVR